MSARASPADWCAAGLALLRDEGIDAVTVDRLCAALEKTKGSFYHHFRDLDAYLASLLARWEDDLTDRPIREAAREADPRRRGARLDDLVSGLDHRLDEWHSFRSEMAGKGITIEDFAIECRQLRADVEVGAALGVEPGTPVWRLRRVRGDVFRRRPVLGPWDWAVLAGRSLTM